jgi:hyperosmotically inducible protein
MPASNGQKEELDTMRIGKTITAFVGTALLAASSFGAAASPPEPTDLNAKVRQAINGLAYYGVFDDIGYTVNDGVVTLTGEVRTYPVHNSAISSVRNIPGVTRVIDNIEVLPLSPYDDNLRMRAYNAIFNYPALSRYAIRSRSPIRILVKNGNITLTGVVNSEMDRELIFTRVNQLAGAFSVTNQLRLDSDVSAS